MRQSRDTLQVGPSRMRWTGAALVIDNDEISAPRIISRVRGRITLAPSAVSSVEAPLTPDGRHVWRPSAPHRPHRGRLTQGHRWQGHGYFDANFGTAALEANRNGTI